MSSSKVTGISLGAGVYDLDPSAVRSTFSAIRAAGASMVRIDVPWPMVEPEPGQFTWSEVDQVVGAATGAGLGVLAILDYTPSWARPATCQSSSKCAPADPSLYGAFAGAAARHLGALGVVDYEIWNEENSHLFFQPLPDPALYTSLLRAAWSAIQAALPGATVLVGGMSPAVTTEDGTWISPEDFLSDLYADGAHGNFNGVAIHPYSYPAMPMDPSTASWNTFYRLPLIHQIMVDNGDGDLPVWLTEYGAPTNPDVNGAVSEQQQAAMLTAAFTQAEQWPWVGPVFWYDWRDCMNGCDGFGLLHASGQPKPAYAAFVAASAAAASRAVGSSSPSGGGGGSGGSQGAAGSGGGSSGPGSGGAGSGGGTSGSAGAGSGSDGTSGSASSTPPGPGSGGSASPTGSGTGGAGVSASPALVVAGPSGETVEVEPSGTTVLGPGRHLDQPVVGIAATPSGQGYWLAAADGGVFSFGNAPYLGSLPAILGSRAEHLAAPIVSVAADPKGDGYWLTGADGGVFAFGDAPYLGSVPAVLGPGRHLDQPVVGIAATPSGQGYWLAAADGGVFSFGNAPYLGSLPAILGSRAEHLAAPIVAIAADPTGTGYWLLGADGGVFAFGGAPYLGSIPALVEAGTLPSDPMDARAIVPTPTGAGYWIVGAHGGVYSFGDAASLPAAAVLGGVVSAG